MKKNNPYQKLPTITGARNHPIGKYFDIRDIEPAPEDPAKIDCLKCVHFYVTWEPTFPRGCKLFGFKTAQLPCDVVRSTTGMPCQAYENKKRPAQS